MNIGQSFTDRDELAQAARLFLPAGSVIELRAFDCLVPGLNGRYPVKTVTGYFDCAEKLAAEAGRIQSARGCYITLNPADPRLLARASNRLVKAERGATTNDKYIVLRRWLYVDLDCQRPAEISSSDEEHAAAFDRARAILAELHARGWPDPVSADSGNGAHLLYLVDLPADDGGLIQRCLQSLDKLFSDAVVKVDTGNFNESRIIKLYGTRACKGDDTPDRPHRMSKLLRVPDDLQPVPRELLEALANEVGQRTEQPEKGKTESTTWSFDLDAFVQQHFPHAGEPESWDAKGGRGRKWVLPVCPFNDDHADRSAFLGQMGNGAIAAGCKHDSCTWGWRELRQRFEVPVDLSRILHGADHATTQATACAAPYTPFPVGALPEPIREFVDAGARAIGCDSSFVALPLLAALAAAIGNTRRLQLKRGWSAPSILWTAVVGESGTSKTPAFKLAMRPVRERQQLAFKAHAAAMKQYEIELAHYERAMMLWKRDKRAEALPPARPDPPVAERSIVADCTLEALGPLLLENPRGLLVARDELAAWLGSFDRYAGGKGGADAASWLPMHTAESISIDRKTGFPRTIFVPQAAVSVTGGIQPTILHRALGVEHRESGLAARLLLACPPRRAKRWTERDIDPRLEAKVAGVIDRLYSLQQTVDDAGDPRPVVIRLGRDAKRLWTDFYDRHCEAQAGMAGELAAVFAKLEETPARLALVIHYCRWAAGEGGWEQDTVDESSMSAGITLTEWFKNEALRVHALLGESDEQREFRLLLDWIRQRGGRATARDVRRGLRKYETTDDAERALRRLAKAGHGTLEIVPPTTGGGRPTEVFVMRVDETSKNLRKTEVSVTSTPIEK